ncbi:hypothetical protein K438DRAFT_1759092 [Mycena galopus ATCC 62051]|nr:hypothetical protein K438DRAFT_1780804 [Mycena galopus ATCC 62051]KAF8200074.1 hypothetical protein K438DRAFT_1759092 [Mycena galopus ATCC 62051]
MSALAKSGWGVKLIWLNNIMHQWYECEKKEKLGVGPARMLPTFESLKVGSEINVHTLDAEWRMELTHYHYHRCCVHIVRQGGQAMNAGERGEGGTKDLDGSSSRYKAQT